MLVVPSANAAFPGTNGKIAFEHYSSSTPADRGIWVMDSDGTNRIQLTTSPLREDHSPAWSADGRHIAFARDRGIWVMNADGSGQQQIVPPPPGHSCPFPPCAQFGHPAWSRDGAALAFDEYNQYLLSEGQPYDTFELHTAKADGTGEAFLVQKGTEPRWSPDGARIGYTFFAPGADAVDLSWITPDGSSSRRVTTSIDSVFGDWSPDATLMSGCHETGICYTINPDGTGQTRLPGNVTPMRWSPDGSKFLWSNGRNIFTTNTDGTDQVDLTNNPPGGPIDILGDWQPISNHPPDCSGVAASRPVLRTANHRLVPITLDGATDPDGDPVTLTIDGVTQDERVVGSGDNTSPDAVNQGDGQLRVRAERNPHGDGRVYRIAFTASDGRGGSCSGTATESVPRKKHKPAVDSAPPSYDSLVR
jgi:hypothetical protein